MRWHDFKPKTIITLILIFPAGTFWCFKLKPVQSPGTIVLLDEHLPVTPKAFYIASVVDGRDNRQAVAWVITAGSPLNKTPKPVAVDFQGGGFNAIKKFIDYGLPKNKAYRPVTMRVVKFTDTETALTNGRVEGHIILVLSFELESGEGETLHLTDYNGSTSYERQAGPPQEIETALRHTLENGLNNFNSWMDKQAGTNIKLAKKVKLSFTDYNETAGGDTIYYATDRPLTWADFQSRISSGKYDAEVFPSIGYTEQVDVFNAIVNVSLAIKVFLPKSACWVRPGSRNDYALDHEQRHFDIAKIAAERFKQKLMTENLPVNNYDGFINVDFLDAYRDMDSLQKQYDDETRHGANPYAQENWGLKIDKWLKEYRVK